MARISGVDPSQRRLPRRGTDGRKSVPAVESGHSPARVARRLVPLSCVTKSAEISSGEGTLKLDTAALMNFAGASFPFLQNGW